MRRAFNLPRADHVVFYLYIYRYRRVSRPRALATLHMRSCKIYADNEKIVYMAKTAGFLLGGINFLLLFYTFFFSLSRQIVIYFPILALDMDFFFSL